MRCVWLDTPLAQAQVNLVDRLLDRFGSLPSPEELRAVARKEPGVHAPTSQMRTVRELEPPAADEGFAGVEQVAFARRPARGAQGGVFVAAAALRQAGWRDALEAGDRPHLVFDWSPDGTVDDLGGLGEKLQSVVSGPVGDRSVPAPGRPTDLLVPPAAPGSSSGLLTGTPHRPGALDSHRHRPGASHARDDAGRPLHRGGRLDSATFRRSLW